MVPEMETTTRQARLADLVVRDIRGEDCCRQSNTNEPLIRGVNRKPSGLHSTGVTPSANFRIRLALTARRRGGR